MREAGAGLDCAAQTVTNLRGGGRP